MTTNDIDRALNAVADFSNRLMRGIADRVEATTKAIDTEALADALTGMRATVTPESCESEEVLPPNVSTHMNVWCCVCAGKHMAPRILGGLPWVCQQCAVRIAAWDGVTQTVSLVVVGAGETV